MQRQGISPQATPSAVSAPTLNPRGVRWMDIDIRGLSEIGPTFAAAAQQASSTEREQQIMASEALGKYAAEFFKNREAFVRKVREGKIREFENVVARRWVMSLDSAMSIGEFNDEIVAAIPDLAKAKGPGDELMAPGDFDKFASELWTKKYASRYANNTAAGQLVIGKDLPQVIAGARSMFAAERGKNEIDVGKTKSVRHGGTLVSSLASPTIAFFPEMIATYQSAWKDLWTNVHGVSLDSGEMARLQLNAVESGLNTIAEPSMALQIIPLVKQLSMGASSTIGDDPVASQRILAIQRDLRSRVDEQHVLAARTRGFRAQDLKARMDASIYTELYDLRLKGASPQTLMERARAWINANASGDLAEFRGELTEYADQTISNMERSAVMQDNGDERAKQLASTLIRKAESGYQVSGIVSALDPESLPAGLRTQILQVEANVQRGSATLEASKFRVVENDLRQMLSRHLTGARNVDEWSSSKIREYIEQVSDDFRKNALAISRPLQNQDGSTTIKTPLEVDAWIDSQATNYEKKISTFIQELDAGQKKHREALVKMQQFRVGPGDDFNFEEAGRFLSSSELSQRVDTINRLKEPLSDFGDSALRMPALSSIERRIGEMIAFRKKQAGPRGIELEIAKKTGEPVDFTATPSEVAAAMEVFEVEYGNAATEIRGELYRANTPGLLPSRLLKAANEAALKAAGIETPQGNEPASSATQTETKPQDAVAASADATAAAEEFAEPTWEEQLRKAEWMVTGAVSGFDYAFRNLKTPQSVLSYRLSHHMREIPEKINLGPAERLFRSYTFKLEYRTLDGTPPGVLLDRDLRSQFFEPMARVSSDTSMSPEEKMVAITNVGALAGMFSPDEWLAGTAQINPPEALRGEFYKRYKSTRDAPEVWNESVFKTRADRYVESMMKPRLVKLAQLENPFIGDYGFRSTAVLNEWLADGRLAKLLSSLTREKVPATPEIVQKFADIQRSIIRLKAGDNK